MKRDMDLIRQIVLATADLEYGAILTELPDVAPEVFATHVAWMDEAGLVKATHKEGGGGSMATFAAVFRLTWDGCEFADAVRSDTLWSKAKSNILKPGISFTFDVLKDWLKSEITQGLPTIRTLGQ